MDEIDISWSTPIAALVACAAGGVALVIAAVAVPNDRPGQVLLGAAALGLIVIAGLGFVQRPKLAVLRDGRLRVNRLTGAQVFTPDAIGVRVVRYPRLGRRVPMLEIDVHANDRLLVFGRWDLGVAPDDVYDILVDRGL